MGFLVGDTGAPGISRKKRIRFLGQCTDLNAISWMVATLWAHRVPTGNNAPNEAVSTDMRGGYTNFLYLSLYLP
jgi:hypothetical protein